jgi:nucleoside 2-deoxyribosyltransferase
MGKKIYFAAPLFSDAELEYNLRVCEVFEKRGYEVFLPQRDGAEFVNSSYNKISKDERRRIMFEMDMDKIIETDIFLFILDGRVPDEGACVELGIAYSCNYFKEMNKILVGLHTDSRAAFIGGKLNPMLKVPLNYITEDIDDLLKYLEKN